MQALTPALPPIHLSSPNTSPEDCSVLSFTCLVSTLLVTSALYLHEVAHAAPEAPSPVQVLSRGKILAGPDAQALSTSWATN